MKKKKKKERKREGGMVLALNRFSCPRDPSGKGITTIPGMIVLAAAGFSNTEEYSCITLHEVENFMNNNLYLILLDVRGWVWIK